MAGGDRDKALDTALLNIEKQFGKGSVMRLGDETRAPLEIIPTGSFNPSGELTVYEHDEFAGHADGWRFDQLEVHLDQFGLDNKVSSYRRSF
jgi:hypothetical protein